MNNSRTRLHKGIGILIALFFAITPVLAAPPDLTAGDAIPANLETTWNLGPTGMRGWVFYDTAGGGINGSFDSRQIEVRTVAAGSPAQGVFQPGDLILGASGTSEVPALFDIDARRGLATAIADAEARDPADLQLIRWRSGAQSVVTITLRTMGAYSATAPYDCPKSEQILREGMTYFFENETSGRYGVGVLNLLAAQDDFFPEPERELYWQRAETELRGLMENSFVLNQLQNYTASTAYPAPWQRAYKLILLGEYYLLTEDEDVLPTIEALAINIAKGSSHFGTVGHAFRTGDYDPLSNFRPVNTGYGVVNSVGMLCLLGVQLAQLCGVDDPVVNDMAERAKMFYASYAGKGSIPYGEHAPFDPRHENNGVNALATILLEDDPAYQSQAEFYVKMVLASGDTERDAGHTGAYFNYLWAPMGVQRGGPAAVQAYFKEVSWLLDLHRRWDGGFDYDSYSENRAPNGEEYYNFRMSTAMLLTYALPLQNLHITGRNSAGDLVLSQAQISESMDFEDYDASARSIAQLVADLGVWSPKVRKLAAAELGNRSIDSTTRNQIRSLAMDVEGNSRYGAIQALREIGDTDYTGQLVSLLEDDDGYVRTLAAEALHSLPNSYKVPYQADMLTTLVSRARPTFPADPEDPLQLDQDALITAIFGSNALVDNRSEMNSLIADVGSELFFDALKVASRHPTGSARSRISDIYEELTPSEVDLMAPELVDMVALGAYADRMFMLGVRINAMQAMARNLVADAVPAAMQAIDGSNNWGQFHNNLFDVLITYGGSSTLVTPDPDVVGFAQSYLSGPTSERAQQLLDAIGADSAPTPPVAFKRIVSATADHPNVDTATNTTNLRVTAIDHAEGDSIFSWELLSGPSIVTITPNGTDETKSTLDFDGTPGDYEFQVTMSDSRGFTETYETVSVTLIDSDGQDVIPPYIDPAIWEIPPTAVDETTITMTAMTAVDPSGVEYYFASTFGGGNDSGWQDSPTYIDTGLTPATSYGYQLMVRDKSPNQNQTELFTPAAFATTDFIASHSQANPGGPYEIPAGGSLSLDGSASLPSEGETITSWEWDLRNDGTFDLTGETPAAITILELITTYGMVVGSNTIRLRVTDTADRVSTITGTVEVGPPLSCQLGILDLSANGGINPNTGHSWQIGDTYRIAFHTQGATTTTSNDPEYYNDFVTSEAWQVDALQGAYWRAMVTVNLDPDTTQELSPKRHVRDNTGTDDTSGGTGQGGAGAPVYVLDGSTCIARNNADIWNGWSNPFDGNSAIRLVSGSTNLNSDGASVTASQNVYYSPFLDQFGLGDTANVHGRDVATGTNSSGGHVNALGDTTDSTSINRGSSNANSSGRVWNRFGAATTSELALYAISVPLTIVDLTDPVPPGLVSIDDDRSGGDFNLGDETNISYTVTFDRPINAASFTVDDFENIGTAATTITAIRGTLSSSVFEVIVAPSGPGTLQLSIRTNAQIEDAVGNSLDTSFSLDDDTVIDVLEPIPSGPYADWASANGLLGMNAGPSAILHDDGLTNLQKFAFGMDPNLPGGGLLDFVLEGEIAEPGLPTLMDFTESGTPLDMRAIFIRRKDHAAAGVIYTIQFSADLREWTSSEEFLSIVSVESSNSDYEVVSIPFPASVPVEDDGPARPAQFMRASVSVE